MEVSDGALLDMIRHHFIVRVPDAPSPQPAPDVSSFQAGPKRGSKLAAGLFTLILDAISHTPWCVRESCWPFKPW